MSKSVSLIIETQTENDEVLSVCHVNERMLALETSYVANKMFSLNRGLFEKINMSTKLIGGTLFRQEITKTSSGNNSVYVQTGDNYEFNDVEIAQLMF